ncbi:aminotransferase class V-fold PLP-dependent enzyme [Sphaerisporangium sp. B11E5]|uniref:aminotransferase class V-fold PLP-dependent enzyme n=1 Tax=Sphaerisporangium sp. B11E5 TaxID=3153563 RepID=UPI00325ECE29
MNPFHPGADRSGFFDWASTAPLSTAARQAMADFGAALESAPCPPDFLTEATAALDSLRALLRRLCGAPPTWDVVLTRGVAESASIIAAGIGAPPGASVVVDAAAHEAAVLPWAARPGLDLRTVPGRPHLDPERAAPLIDESTVAVCASHVTHLDGAVQPVRELAAIARARSGALVVVDGAQAAGNVPVDVRTLGADIYLGSGRKFLLSPLGTGFILARPGLLTRVAPLVLSTRAAVLHRDADGRWRRAPGQAGLPRALEGNLPDLRCLAGLSASVQAYLGADAARLAGRRRRLTEMLSERLAETTFRCLHPPGAGIVRLASPRVADHLHVKRALARTGVFLAATTAWIRVSLHAANSENDVHRLTGCLKELE